MAYKCFNTLMFSSVKSLGDLFVLNAIVLDLARKSNKLQVPVLPWQYKTIKCLYSEVDNIEPIVFETHDENIEWLKNTPNIETISCSPMVKSSVFFNGMKEPLDLLINWERQLYEGMGYMFEARYSGFRLPKYIEGEEELYDQLTQGNTEYAIIHNQSASHPDGYHITIPLYNKNLVPIYIKEGLTDNFLQYRKLIQNAREIHVVPSSVHSFIDGLPRNTLKAPHLFFHDIRSRYLSQINSHLNDARWIPVSYSLKW